MIKIERRKIAKQSNQKVSTSKVIHCKKPKNVRLTPFLFHTKAIMQQGMRLTVIHYRVRNVALNRLIAVQLLLSIINKLY